MRASSLASSLALSLLFAAGAAKALPDAPAAAPAVPDSLAQAAQALAEKLAEALARSPERANVRAVAVPAFAATGAAAELAPAAAEQVASRLGAVARVQVLDRSRLSATLGEARLKAAVAGGDPAEVELGLRAGAEAVLVGSLVDAGSTLTLQARIILVSSGRVVGSAQQAFAAPAPKRVAGSVESHSIEVAMRRLADGLASGFGRLPGNARYRRLAVLPFTEVGDEAQKHKVGLIVSAEVATDLQRDHNLLLVERQKLVEVMGELRLQNSGAVDPARAGEIGKLSDAQALVIGTTSGVGDHYLVNARIVATETGETLASESASVSAVGMVALASDAVVLRSKKDAAFRSLLIPGWGQMYNRQPVKGGVLLGAEAGLLGASLVFHLLGNHAYDQYTSRTTSSSLGPDPTGQAQQLYDTAASRYRVRNGLLIGAAAVWLFGVVDAWASGVDGDRLLGSGVALAAPEPGGARVAWASRF